MKRIFTTAIAAITAAELVTNSFCIKSFAEEAALTDSGISYTESVETLSNPAVGYSSTVWAKCTPENTPIYDPTGNLMLFFINIGGFSSGSNGSKNDDGTYIPGIDYDFDEAFFEAWDKTLSNCRKNGCMAALRFRYDENGNDDPEPATFEQVLHHIEQLKESGLFEKYSDIIAYVECGFVGKWGEQHGGKYTSLPHKAQLLEAILQAVPSPIPVTVRTPNIFAEWAGIKLSEINDRELINSLTESEYTSDIQANKDRIGLYNDGYMGSSSDLGTYSNREIETDWLSEQTLTSYFGGEFSGNINYAKEFDTYLPENAIPEMYKTHLSYINGNIFDLYNDYTFSEVYSPEGVDNSAYYGQTVFKFIRDHIGYRFVLRDSKLTESAEQGGKVQVKFKIENTGFANVIPSVQSYIILEKDGVFNYAETDIDCRSWTSMKISDNTINFELPDNLTEGDWNIYIKLNMGTPISITEMSGRSIRFANDGVWNSSMGANYLGSIKVVSSNRNGTKNHITASDDITNASHQFYSVSSKTVADGMLSNPYEWTEDMLLETNSSGVKLYAKSDDNYLYVMSNVKNDAAAPVYNLQLKNKSNGESYWIYFASNGFVYFNHGDYGRSLCKWSNDMVEFRIPFETMGLSAGTELSDIRIFMQDSGNGWKLMSDVTASGFTVDPDIVILSAETSVCLENGGNYSYTVVTELDNEIKYEWFHNGKLIENENSSKIELTDISAENEGEYNVKLTSSSGIEKTVTAFRITVADNGEKYIAGDANCDGKVTIADSTSILQYLGNEDKYSLTPQGKINADVDGSVGITGMDAITLQKVDAKLLDISELPLFSNASLKKSYKQVSEKIPVSECQKTVN